MAIERHPEALAEEAGRIRPFAVEYDDVVRDGGEKIRTEEKGHIVLDVYRLTDRDGRRTVYVTADENRLVVRQERYDRKSASTTTTEYVEWMRGLSLPDAFFEPSSDVKLQRFTLEEYVEKVKTGRAGPVPVLYNYHLRGHF